MEFRTIFGTSLLLVLLLQTNVFGDETFRCHGRIISVGDYQSDVLDKCGQPDHTDQWEEKVEEFVSEKQEFGRESHRVGKRVEKTLQMERWTYNLGSGKFIRYLLFRNSELIKINTGDKGKN